MPPQIAPEVVERTMLETSQELETDWKGKRRVAKTDSFPELQKRADGADQSVLIFPNWC